MVINDREISRCLMRLPYSFFVVVFLVLLIFASAIVSAESPGPVPTDTNSSIQDISALLSNEPAGVVVYFFYNQNCGECQKALTFMGEFHERHPEVIIRSFDIADNISNQHLFRQFNQRYNIPVSSVPAVFVGELGLTDFENIELHLDDIVVQIAQNQNSTAPVPSESISPVQVPDISGSNHLTILLLIIAGLMIIIGITVLVGVFYK